MPQQFSTVATEDETLNRVQQNIRLAVDPLSRDLMLNRSLVSAQVTTSTVTVLHNLGRQPIGWFLVDKDADARVWRTAWTSTTITLDSSATVNVKIILF